MFPLEAKTKKKKWPEMHERHRAWFSPEVAAALVSEPGLGRILLGFACVAEPSGAKISA